MPLPMTSDVATQTRIAELDAMDDSALCQLDWKTMTCLNGRLLELHAEGQLGNETLAKLPRRPILCIDQIDRIDEEAIEATLSAARCLQVAASFNNRFILNPGKHSGMS